MKTTGIKSEWVALCFVLGSIFFAVSVATGVAIGGDGGIILIIPALICVGIMIYYGYFLFALPSEIVIVDHETENITVFQSRKKSVTFSAGEVANISQYNVGRSGGMDDKMCNMTFSFDDDREDIVAYVLANPDDIVNALLEIGRK